MTTQWRDPDPLTDESRRTDELERARIEAMERDVAEDPDMSGSVVEPAEPSSDPRVGGAVVGGALGAVAGAIVGGPAGAIVGGAVGAAGGAVVAGNNDVEDGTIVDIDHPEMSSQIRRPADEELVDR
jgi:hypothetical protein